MNTAIVVYIVIAMLGTTYRLVSAAINRNISSGVKATTIVIQLALLVYGVVMIVLVATK